HREAAQRLCELRPIPGRGRAGGGKCAGQRAHDDHSRRTAHTRGHTESGFVHSGSALNGFALKREGSMIRLAAAIFFLSLATAGCAQETSTPAAAASPAAPA